MRYNIVPMIHLFPMSSDLLAVCQLSENCNLNPLFLTVRTVNNGQDYQVQLESYEVKKGKLVLEDFYRCELFSLLDEAIASYAIRTANLYNGI